MMTFDNVTMEWIEYDRNDNNTEVCYTDRTNEKIFAEVAKGINESLNAEVNEARKRIDEQAEIDLKNDSTYKQLRANSNLYNKLIREEDNLSFWQFSKRSNIKAAKEKLNASSLELYSKAVDDNYEPSSNDWNWASSFVGNYRYHLSGKVKYPQSYQLSVTKAKLRLVQGPLTQFSFDQLKDIIRERTNN